MSIGINLPNTLVYLTPKAPSLLDEVVRVVCDNDGLSSLEMNRIMKERGHKKKDIQAAIRLGLDKGRISLGAKFQLIKPPVDRMNVICDDCGARMGDHRIGGGTYHPQPLRPEAERLEQEWQAYMEEAQEINYRDAFRNALDRARQEENDACAEIAKQAQRDAETALVAEQNCGDQDVTYMVELQHAAQADVSANIMQEIVKRRP